MCAVTDDLTEMNADDTSKQLAQDVKDEAQIIVSLTKTVVDLVKTIKGGTQGLSLSISKIYSFFRPTFIIGFEYY